LDHSASPLRFIDVAPFRFLDLFAGIGGFHLALRKLGGECALACDIDPECRRIYEAYFGMKPLSDVAELAETPALVPDHDVLCAGFPCQPFSKSGRQLGVRDRTRGTLFHHILSILEAKTLIGRPPSVVLLENVRNLAGPKHADTLNTIVESLRSLNYEVDDDPIVFSPHLLSPELGGTPQIRERVFIVAVHRAAVDRFSIPQIANEPVHGWHPSRWRIDDVLQDESEIEERNRYVLRAEERKWLAAWQDFIEVIPDDELPGFPIWVPAFKIRPRYEDETPDWKRQFLRKNSAFFRRHERVLTRWINRHRVTEFPDSRQKFEWQARGEPRDLSKLLIHLRPSGIRVRPPTYAPALVAINQSSIAGWRGRRLTPREAAKLQGFPEDFPLAEDNIAYRQFGNAVNVGVVAYIAGRVLTGTAEDARQLELASA